MEQGSSKSNDFDELLEKCEGWIITKNEKGKVKIATCEDNESNIYEKTRDWIETNINKTKTDTLKLPPHQANKIVSFFIRDLLNCDKNDCYFKFWDIIFNQVYICGTITSLFTRKEKYYLSVDDGSSSITCIIKKDTLDKMKDTKLPDIPIDKNNFIFEAAHVIRRHLLHVHSMIPTYNDFTLGNIIKIIGFLTEYNGTRYIFINRIMKPKDDVEHIDHMQTLVKEYRKYYENLKDF